MYDIRQFKPAMYLLLLLGITGYALAAESMGIWLFALIAIGLNAWLVATDRFIPLPRMVANGVTIAALLYVVYQVRNGGGPPILFIGQFLVLLQVIKLFEQRANRDYAQLLVLSLLLVVAAAINTASLFFGVLFVTYLFLSLYCCLLFHLKVETDAAKAALSVPEDLVNLSTLRQDQRYLSKSMRKLTGVVSLVSITTAVIVFLFWPRDMGASIIKPLQFRAAQTLTGFSDKVSFQQIAKLQQNDQVVARVKVWKNNEVMKPPYVLLLRGVTLDRYGGKEPGDGAWRWTRSSAGPNEEETFSPNGGETAYLSEPNGEDRWVQEISLLPTGTSVLFALAGVESFRPNRTVKFRYSKGDGSMVTTEALTTAVDYVAVSSGDLGNEPMPRQMRRSNIDPMIEEYARRPEVTAGFAEERDNMPMPHELDALIASKIEAHLRKEFQYDLDLTDTERIEGQDPMVAFLYDFKRGHCEYFAGAMTLLCQSLGMTARMVVGFKCDEYNEYGDFYNVKQMHAHAWVEVLTMDGWRTFDPTSDDEVARAREAGTWQKMKHLFDFLEYKWANYVVAYDKENRESLIESAEQKITNAAIQGSEKMKEVQNWFNPENFYFVSSGLLMTLMGLSLVALVVAVGWYIRERWLLLRRAARIGLDALPQEDQLRLVRQLGFYDDLLRLLERHKIERPKHLTPMEFSRSLSYLPADIYESVNRLTKVFYRIRYGRAELHPAARRRLDVVIEQIESSLAAKK